MNQRFPRALCGSAVSLLLFSSHGLAQRPAASISADAPKPPSQPASGPGGASYTHGAVKKFGPFGEGGKRYWLYEPDAPVAASAPVIVFLHGYTGVNSSVYGGWIEHLVRRGNIVVYPIYQAGFGEPETYTSNALAAVKDAFRRLREEPGHVRPDTEGRWAIVGHSLGCPIGANLAGLAEAEGLPKPRAYMACNAGDANSIIPVIPPILASPAKIPDLLMLVISGADDKIAGERTGRQIFEESTAVSAANKNFIHIESDRTGIPSLEANHFAPLAINTAYDNGAKLNAAASPEAPATSRGPLRSRMEARMEERKAAAGGITPGNGAPGFGRADALDYYGYWKWLDGLTDAAFYGKNRQFALGDTPEQKSLGIWSNGTPVHQAVVEKAK